MYWDVMSGWLTLQLAFRSATRISFLGHKPAYKTDHDRERHGTTACVTPVMSPVESSSPIPPGSSGPDFPEAMPTPGVEFPTNRAWEGDPTQCGDQIPGNRRGKGGKDQINERLPPNGQPRG